jgi:hypothetical protein
MYKSGTLAIFRETTQGEHKQNIKTENKKRFATRTPPNKTRGRTQVFVKGRQFLHLIRHTACYL